MILKGAEKIKKFTILHSNDIHGDFLPEEDPNQNVQIGGLSLLSSYLNEVHAEEENVIFTISGDIVQGSLIDSEYKGISTVEIINYLSPDVITLGNHELDYGLPHLFFLEKVATFPIVNANLYIKKYNKRLFRPYYIKNIDGFDVMFIGIITESVLQSLKLDGTIGTLVDLADAVSEIGKICSIYKDDDIDLTIILSHIGLDNDKKLAAMLDPSWGVDMILGGHSHSYMEKPEEVNNILIAQAGFGTNQIGRFDIIVDDDTNSIVDWKWKLVEINSEDLDPDPDLQNFIDAYKASVDKKYNSLICRLENKLLNPYREFETPLGDFIADIFAEISNSDVTLIGSASLRLKEFGPVVTLGKIKQLLPYADNYLQFVVDGDKLWKIFSHFLRTENCNNDGECFQVNHSVKALYSNQKHSLQALSVRGEPVKPEEKYTLGIQGFHFQNSKLNLNISHEELMKYTGKKVVAWSFSDAVEEYLRGDHDLNCPDIEDRLVYID